MAKGPTNSAFKFQFQIFRLVGRIFRSDAQLIVASHRVGTRINPGILENAAFITDVEKITIHGIRLLRRGRDRDTMFLSILDHFCAAGKLPPESFVPPWRNDANVRSKRSYCQFKAYLIITLARRAMSDCFPFLPPAYLDPPFPNDRPH